MVKLLILTCILATLVAVVAGRGPPNAPSPAPVRETPAPSGDCLTLIYDMAGCMAFMSNGWDETTPDSSCCAGFKSVVDANADCICYALSTAVSLGIDLNMTRAHSLPTDCGVSGAPPISSCNVTTSPGSSPSASPVPGSPSPSPANPPEAIAPPSNSPISLPPTAQTPTDAPISLPPTAQTPTDAPAAGVEAPATAPSSDQALAPSPTKAGANAISTTFSTLFVIFVTCLLSISA